MTEPQERGLRSIREAREDRGRGRYSRLTPNLLLFALLVAVASVVVYRFVAGAELGKAKRELLTRHRAVAETLGKEWNDLRPRLEKYTLEASGAFRGDFVDSIFPDWDFRRERGIYLRLRLAEANEPGAIRRAAERSLRDGFTACLLLQPEAPSDGGLRDERPWNLRQLYATTRVLDPEWLSEVDQADDSLRLRVFQQQFDRALREDVPLAVEIVKGAKFFLLVLDEDVEEARALGDGGITAATLQRVSHPARVHVLDLRTGNEALRMRVEGTGKALVSGERIATNPEAVAAMERQLHNCDLAKRISDRLASKH